MDSLFSIAFGLIGGALFLMLGLRFKKRKPIIIPPKAIWIGGVSLVLYPFLLVSFKIITTTWNPDRMLFSLAESLAVLLVVFVLHILPIALLARYFHLFNVSEAMVVDELGKVLQENGLEYSVRQSRNIFLRNAALYGITIELSGQKSAIKLIFGYWGRAYIRFGRKKLIQNYDAIVTDFRRGLATRKYDGGLHFAFLSFALAIMMIGMTIYYLFQTLIS